MSDTTQRVPHAYVGVEIGLTIVGSGPCRVLSHDLSAATVHWLEAVYKRQRRHSAIDMLSPVDYEEHYWDRRAAA